MCPNKATYVDAIRCSYVMLYVMLAAREAPGLTCSFSSTAPAVPGSLLVLTGAMMLLVGPQPYRMNLTTHSKVCGCDMLKGSIYKAACCPARTASCSSAPSDACGAVTVPLCLGPITKPRLSVLVVLSAC
jgi:hypothetical protein